MAYSPVGMAAWQTTLQKTQREALDLGETRPNAKGQSCCNLHISILRLSPTLLTHMILIIICKWKFREQQAVCSEIGLHIGKLARTLGKSYFLLPINHKAKLAFLILIIGAPLSLTLTIHS